MNKRKSLYDIASFYNKNAILKASYKGMRYLIKKINENEKDKLGVWIWPEPYCFEKTDKEKMQMMQFSYTEEGLDEAYDWLCKKYEEDIELWNK